MPDPRDLFNAAGSGAAELAVTIVPATGEPPKIDSQLDPHARQGVAFSYQIGATNNATSYSAAGLTDGLTVNQTAGKITGTPVHAGTYGVTIAAFNAAGSGHAKLTLVVKSPE